MQSLWSAIYSLRPMFVSEIMNCSAWVWFMDVTEGNHLSLRGGVRTTTWQSIVGWRLDCFVSRCESAFSQ